MKITINDIVNLIRGDLVFLSDAHTLSGVFTGNKENIPDRLMSAQVTSINPGMYGNTFCLFISVKDYPPA